MESLTGFEVIAIEEHFRGTIDNIGGVKLTLGVVWAYRNRTAKTSWGDVKAMSLKELNTFFAEPPDTPDDEVGKGSPADEPPTQHSPTGA